jgi:tetratricopeptide (TPR) repeat protein
MTATKYGGNSLLGLIDDGYKYIQTTRPELYDLVNDPKESEDLIEQDPQRARILQDKLKQLLEESVSESTKGSLELDAEALEKLETLGYVGASIEEELSFDQEKPDPKDLLKYHNDMAKIQGFLMAENYDRAEELCEELIPLNNPETIGQLYNFMVSIAKKKDDPQKIIQYIQKSIEIEPDRVAAYVEYGKALLAVGQTAQAEVQFLKAHELSPGSEIILGNIAKAYYDGRKLNKAIEYCHKALELNPKYLLVRTSLADTLKKTKQFELAIKQYYLVLEQAPDDPEALNMLAWLQAISKDITLFNPSESLRLALINAENSDYKSPQILDTLAAAYAANSQFKEAIETAQKAIQIAKEQELNELAGRIASRLKLYRSGQRVWQ